MMGRRSQRHSTSTQAAPLVQIYCEIKWSRVAGSCFSRRSIVPGRYARRTRRDYARPIQPTYP
eukprot:95740-Rhodomonas_salina.1